MHRQQLSSIHAVYVSISGSAGDARRGGERRRAHLHVGVALHDLLDARERERRVPVVGRLLLSGVDLTLPKRLQERVQRLAWLDERRRGHRAWRWWRRGFVVQHCRCEPSMANGLGDLHPEAD